MTIHYEWDVETFTLDEHEDITDHNHSDACPGIPTEPDQRLVLVRDTWSDADGLTDRQWAYVVDGVLPEYFEDAYQNRAARVPKRFHAELKALEKAPVQRIASENADPPPDKMAIVDLLGKHIGSFDECWALADQILEVVE